MIKTIQTADFMGLPGMRKFDFENKLAAFCGQNAVGKTSVLSAVRYVLTGVEPTGETVTSGKARAAVQIEFDNGVKLSKIKYAAKGKAQKYYVGEKRVTTDEFNSALAAQMNGKISRDAKIIASSELIRSLSSKKLGDILMAYIPELMEKEDVTSRITGLTDEYRQIISDLLPEGEFGVGVLDEMYAGFVENRKIAKRKIAEEKAVLDSYDAFTPPEETREQLEKELADLTSRRDEAITYSAKKKDYDNLKKQAEKHAEIIKNLEKEISEAVIVKHTEEERNAAAVLLDAYRTTVTSAYSAMQTALSDEKALEKAINTIGQPICPLSEKLVCTTDKSKILGDLKKSLEDCRKSYRDQKSSCENARLKVKEIEANIAKINADETEARRIEALIAQKQQLENTIMPQVPEEPVKGEDPKELEKKMTECRRKIQYLDKLEKISRIRGQLAENEKILKKYEFLADAFSPKGEVKRAVTMYYLDEFASPCNEKAGKLFPGMNIRFVPEGGVSLLVDAKGNGSYLSFDSLSEGEKVCVTFLLMSMLAELSGFRILIIDELSVLDRITLEKLIRVLKEYEKEYDMAILACVDHDDTKQVLEEQGIDMIEC